MHSVDDPIDAGRRRLTRAALGAWAAGGLGATAAHAQSPVPTPATGGAGGPAWPAKPVTVIVPFPAGGGTDAFARPLFAHLTRQTGKQFVIDNRGGAGGTLGAGIAAHATPDGYTFFMGGAHHAIAPSMYPKLDYRLVDDFIPVGLVASPPQVIVVAPQRVAARNVAELLTLARAQPGRLNYASAGNGTSHHLAGELFKQQTRTFITHIPYRGAGPALQDLIAGQVDIMFDGLGSSAQHIKAGRIRALAVASAQRAPGFPDIPSATEAGLPDYRVSTWYGLWAPRGTPPAIVEAMTAELRKALATDEIRAAWTGLGTAPPNLWGAEFGRFVAQETQRWAKVVATSAIKPD